MQPTGNQSAGKPTGNKPSTPIDAFFEFFERNNFIIVPALILIVIAIFILVLAGNHQRASLSANVNSGGSANATLIASLSTQDRRLDMQLDDISRQISGLEQTVQAMQTTATPPEPTAPPAEIRWDATLNEGFKNDVDFNKIDNSITVDEDEIGTSNGYIYIPLEESETIIFYIKINDIPYLIQQDYSNQETDKNYHLVVGVGDRIEIVNNSKTDPYVQARIYPSFERYHWNCCKILSESSFLKGSELTKDIQSVEINQIIGWKIVVEGDLVTIFVNGEQISSSFSTDHFDHPVVYIGYFQANECDLVGADCHVDFKICDLEPPVK